jgi:hypothetical protein
MEDELELGEGNREERKLGLGLDEAALYREDFSPGW